MFGRLTGRIPIDVEMVGRVLDLHWVADGVTRLEDDAAEHLISIWRSHRDLGLTVYEFPWVVDGITASEVISLWALAGIAYSDPSLASQVTDHMSDLLALSRNLAPYALASLGQIGEFPEDLRPLVAKPWFEDGLDAEEAALIATLVPLVYHSPRLYTDLLQTHYTLSRTVSLPFAGEVTLWAIQNAPFAESEGVLTDLEEAARITESLVGAPFPTTDIILLLLVPDDSRHGLGVAEHFDSHVRITRLGAADPVSSHTIGHETAHFYFDLPFASVWLKEGAADYAAAFIRDGSGGQTLEERKETVSMSLATCVSTGIENIEHLNQRYDRVRDTPGCAYTMGENFLHHVRTSLGEGALSAALRELYLLGVNRGSLWPGTEEEIYRVFLNNTPPGLEDEFLDLYSRFHGGQYDDPEN